MLEPKPNYTPVNVRIGVTSALVANCKLAVSEISFAQIRQMSSIIYLLWLELY